MKYTLNTKKLIPVMSLKLNKPENYKSLLQDLI